MTEEAAKRGEWTDIAEGPFEPSQGIENASVLAPKKRPPNPIAWVINVAPNAWLARCGDQTSNPIPLHAAKSEAMAMAEGSSGDYVVSNPIAQLNGLTAILLDREERPGTLSR